MDDRRDPREGFALVEESPFGWYVVLGATVVAALVIVVSGACSVTSIDSEVKARIEACQKITDEALRVQCLDQVPRPK